MAYYPNPEGGRDWMHIRFGLVHLDPTGELAWKLLETESAAWERGINPRNGRRSTRVRAILSDTAWLLAAPLSKLGLAIIDQRILRVACSKCFATWKLRFNGSAGISKRYLRCPYGCTDGYPLAEVKTAILQAILPEEIPVATYNRLVQSRRSGWVAAPLDLDADAEAEGRALAIFVNQFLVRQPALRRRRARIVGKDVLPAVAKPARYMA